MKRVVMAVLCLGIASCAVDPGPVASPAPASVEEATSSALTSAPNDDSVAPRGVLCDEICTTRAECAAEGGHGGAPCAGLPPGIICCEID